MVPPVGRDAAASGTGPGNSGVQGDAMTVAVCTDNEKIDEDMRLFSQALGTEGEIIGERLRVLSSTLKDMGYS